MIVCLYVGNEMNKTWKYIGWLWHISRLRVSQFRLFRHPWLGTLITLSSNLKHLEQVNRSLFFDHRWSWIEWSLRLPVVIGSRVNPYGQGEFVQFPYGVPILGFLLSLIKVLISISRYPMHFSGPFRWINNCQISNHIDRFCHIEPNAPANVVGIM